MTEAQDSSDAVLDRPALAAAGDSAAAGGLDERTRRRYWIEVVVVILIGVAPSFVYALVSFLEPSRPSPYLVSALSLLAGSVQVMAPVLFIIWVAGAQWHEHGMQPFRNVRDVGLGLAVFLSTYAAWLFYAGTFYSVLAAADWVYPEAVDVMFPSPGTGLEMVLAVVSHAANAFAEELVIWGFLFTRLRVLLNHAGQALILAALLFCSYHVYQGLSAAVSLFLYAAVHGVWFHLTGRLWPLVIAHTLDNLVRDFGLV